MATIAFRVVLFLVLATSTTWPRDSRPVRPTVLSPHDGVSPVYCESEHSTGRLVLGVNNAGAFGSFGGIDCFTGRRLIGLAEFPKGSKKMYLSRGNLVVGAILEGDTLVATSFEPSAEPYGGATFRSSVDPTRPWYDRDAPHHEFKAVYYDTCSDCSSKSLMIEVTEKSMSWGFDYAQDFVLFDYSIKNVGTKRLRQLYIGIFVDGDVYYRVDPPIMIDPRANDDMVGFLETFPAKYLGDDCPPVVDTLNIGWTADDDANLTFPQVETHVRGISGLRFIRTPRDSLPLSFNWWSRGTWWNPSTGFGPQRRSSYRPLESGGYGGPGTDEEWYHFLRNGERDYDQAWQASQLGYDAIWIQPPPELRDSVLINQDPRFMISTGPFGLFPGQSLQFTTVYVAGSHFHRDANIHRFLPYDPVSWYSRVWFDQLAQNAVWAEWIYDNPGVDTDGDGYAGEFIICDLAEDSVLTCDTLIDSAADPDTAYIHCYWSYDIPDTVWIKGDGIADFKGAYAPPNPSTYSFVNKHGETVRGLRVYPEAGRIRMVWNGVASENSPDPFSRRIDFEGYRVYMAHDERRSSFSLITSYDRENYSRWQYDQEARRFVCAEQPFTLEELRCLHGDSCGDTTWYPEKYTKGAPLVYPSPKGIDKIYYFSPMDYNRSILGNDPVRANTLIKKVYPDAIKPTYVHPDSIKTYFADRDDTTYFTPEGFLKYYEYEYTFEGILSTVSYWVNVTAFDHGHPELGVQGLESDPSYLPKAVYPMPSSEIIAKDGLGVIVYPNPYRLDANYRKLQYEGRQLSYVPEDKTRLIHFSNLPPKCTISIFSLDGDLIRQLKHDVDPLDYLANHETWNLISRNMQGVVSGLYYWTVDDHQGNSQIGKLVILM